MQATNTFVQNITVLTAIGRKTVKRYQIDQHGQLQCIPYDHEKYFNYNLEKIQNIEQLSTLLTALSQQQNAILIRGIPIAGLPKPAERKHDKFPEGDEGRYWAMLDFDNISLPEGMDPTSRSAVENIVKQLPSEFHNASYFFQFSSSAGILKPDGTPLKAGLNVHLFFWFERPIHGKKLSAYFESHCYLTGFYEETFDSGGNPRIKLGIDLSLLREVQPHYVGLPIIGAGVTSTLALADRQGLVKKRSNSVPLPEMEASLIPDTISTRKRLLNAWKTNCGFVPARITTRAAHGGISISTYYRNLNGPSPSTNRIFLEAKLYGEKQDAVILYFEGEYSPGSFFVKQSSPQLAIRFGDYGSTPLKELSEGAYAYVRDELHWFSEIAHVELALNDAGFIPNLNFCTSRVALIQAPTGCGKTTAFVEYAKANNGIIIYAAQTIALGMQMYADLTKNGTNRVTSKSRQHCVPWAVHYADYRKGELLKEGVVYITTNESLHKFIDAAIAQGVSYELVIDEVHVALDDFMATNAKNELFEKSIARASRVKFMTGTITNLQISKLLDTVSRACGVLKPETYSSYQFHPVKSNPLFIVDMSRFGADFVALLRHYSKLKEDGLTIPQTCIIVPTTRMRVFEMLLDNFGLIVDSSVVSRQESLAAEIERARTSNLPIRISSPVFALGLNYDVDPEIFITFFSSLQVDENHVIQTLNRANRNKNIQCEVRLYVGVTDARPVMIPDAVQEKLRIESYLLDESSIQGLLDAHYQVDRVTYLALRDAEKKTAKSIHRLIEEDAFQNYHVRYDWVDWLDATKEDKKLFAQFNKLANDSYLKDVNHAAEAHGNHSVSLLLFLLEKLFHKKKEFGEAVATVERDNQAMERGVCMAICNVSAEESIYVKPGSIRRLFGALKPYMTAQYSHEITGEWRTVAAEKTLDLIPLLEALQKMRNRQMSENTFATLMKRVSLGKSVKALAENEASFLAWQRKLDRLDEISKLIKTKASKDQKVILIAERFEIARGFLKTIGVNFGTVEVNGQSFINSDDPKVPNWDFEAMIVELQRAAESLKRLPEKPVDKNWENEHWFGAAVSHQLCALCVHCDQDFICALGRPIQPEWDDIDPTTDKCDAFHKLPAKLIPKEPTKK